MPLCQSTGMRVTKGDCRERKFSALLKMLRAGLPRTRKVEKCVVCAALPNIAVEPLAMCYPAGWRHFEGRLTPRFRTIQVCPKDWPARLLQAGGAVVRPLGGSRMFDLRRREFVTLLSGAAAAGTQQWPPDRREMP